MICVCVRVRAGEVRSLHMFAHEYRISRDESPLPQHAPASTRRYPAQPCAASQSTEIIERGVDGNICMPQLGTGL